VLLAKAPHISWPLRFVLPHEPHLRPRLDAAPRPLPLRPSRLAHGAAQVAVGRLRSLQVRQGLKPGFKKGFVYSDAWVDDARLVIANVKSARDMGRRIYARHRCTSARTQRRRQSVEHRACLHPTARP
jgi:glycerol-3-phosphate dehydrogenase